MSETPRQGDRLRRFWRAIRRWAPLSLVVAAVLLWGLSHLVAATVVLFLPGYVQQAVRSNYGTLEFNFRDAEPPQLVPDVEHWQLEYRINKPGPIFGQPTRWQQLGFDLYRSPYRSLKAIRVIVPWWALTIAASTPAVWQATSALRRRRRRRAGLCPACGYDLRGSDIRCPECGHVTKQQHN